MDHTEGAPGEDRAPVRPEETGEAPPATGAQPPRGMAEPRGTLPPPPTASGTHPSATPPWGADRPVWGRPPIPASGKRLRSGGPSVYVRLSCRTVRQESRTYTLGPPLRNDCGSLPHTNHACLPLPAAANVHDPAVLVQRQVEPLLALDTMQ